MKEESGQTIKRNILQVNEYLRLINDTFKATIPSERIVVEGEISDYRVSQKKWVHFDLKDEEEDAVLKCFATVWQIDATLEDGMRVRVGGYPKIYERFGSFSFTVQSVEPVGEGALRKAYEALKKKLDKEGLFAPERKRSIPRFPEKIGVITSRDAAAYGDFKRILNNRWGGVEVLFRHVHVQGAHAVDDMLRAFGLFNDLPKDERPDVLVLTRGGGGLEDLHAFNDEQVARAVFTSDIPVVCGVGHERDESLCDFVADVRASTPSNAAELIVPRREDVRYEIEAMLQRIEGNIENRVGEYERTIQRATRSVQFFIERQKTLCGVLQERLTGRMDGWLKDLRERVASSHRVLKQVDPKRILARGYGLVMLDGAVIRDVKALEKGAEVAIQLAHGAFDAEVTDIDGSDSEQQTLL